MFVIVKLLYVFTCRGVDLVLGGYAGFLGDMPLFTPWVSGGYAFVEAWWGILGLT